MTAQAEKVVEKVDGEKAAMQAIEKAGTKPAEKPIEKRRALGRGLESLLPSGPRVVDRTASAGDAAAGDHPITPKAGVTGTAGSPALRSAGQAGALGTPGGSPALQPGERAGVTGDAAIGEQIGTDSEPIPGTIADLHAAAGSIRRSTDGLPVLEIPLDQIDKNPHQTRSEFDEEFLAELAASIKAQGVIQPIVVRPGNEGRYILILGERRLRASKIAGKTTIPAVVKRVSEQQAAEMTLVENLQREDLNCLDQAAAFQNLSENFNLTQEEIGKRVGVSRETVSNYLRLLRLPASATTYLQTGALTYSHARELLTLENNLAIERMAEKVVKEMMSVDQLEELLLDMRFKEKCVDENAGLKKHRGARWMDPNVRAAQRSLETILGMKVRIRDRKGKGTIKIEYTSLEDYDRVVGLLKGK